MTTSPPVTVAHQPQKETLAQASTAAGSQPAPNGLTVSGLAQLDSKSDSRSPPSPLDSSARAIQSFPLSGSNTATHGHSSSDLNAAQSQPAAAPRPYSFQPGLVYTFDFYQHMLYPASLEFKVALGTFDLARYLNSQPILMMAKLWGSDRYLWNVELWHEKLLNKADER